MSGRAPQSYPELEELIADCNWDSVDNWWRECVLNHPDDTVPLRALLTRLREIVPKIIVQNGMEETERYIRQNDDASHWEGREKLKGAADILELGELEAAAEGHPPEASEIWHDYTTKIKDELRRYVAEPEVTDGEQALSRKAHAQDALEYIEGLDHLIVAMRSELMDEEDRRWFEEAIYEVAYLAFDAGRHTQAAWTKAFERFVPTGRKVQLGQRRAAEVRKRQTQPETISTLAEMDRLITKPGCSVSRAAELAYKNGFGSSHDANRKLYQRHRKK